MEHKNWDKLFEFIAKIERTEKFAVVHETVSSNGVTRPSHLEPMPIVVDFMKLIYGLDLIIKFDWMQWEEGSDILNQKDYDFSQLSTLDLCKVLTVIVRSDRFCEGALVMRFEDGTIFKILKAIQHSVHLGH